MFFKKTPDIIKTELFKIFTVVTTIGYGHTAPVTKAGQAFCIAYSVVGMCLFGLMVSALGALMRNSVLTLCERGLKVRISTEFNNFIKFDTLHKGFFSKFQMKILKKNDSSKLKLPIKKKK